MSLSGEIGYLIFGFILGAIIALLIGGTIVENYIGMPAAYHKNGFACFHVTSLIQFGDDAVYHEICHEPDLEAKCKEYGVPHE